jgi:hypothetical protein
LHLNVEGVVVDLEVVLVVDDDGCYLAVDGNSARFEGIRHFGIYPNPAYVAVCDEYRNEFY